MWVPLMGVVLWVEPCTEYSREKLWVGGVHAPPPLYCRAYNMDDCLVITWNVRGLNSAIKRSLVLNYLKKLRPQVCILVETHLMGSRILSLKRAWVGAHYHAPYSNYARGVSVLVHKALPFQLLDVKLDPGGRYVLLHALISRIPVVIVGVYLPPPS